MYTMCITEKTDQQQRIFEQALLQMLLENYYDEVTVSELCRRAGLSRKTFYRLFEKKQDVLYSLIDRTLLESAYYIPDESVDPGELHRFFAYWQHHKELLDVLLKHQNSSLLTDRSIRIAMREMGSPVRTFGPDKHKGSYEAIVFYLSSIISVLLVWHARDYSHSIDELSTMVMDLLTAPAIQNPSDY